MKYIKHCVKTNNDSEGCYYASEKLEDIPEIF